MVAREACLRVAQRRRRPVGSRTRLPGVRDTRSEITRMAKKSAAKAKQAEAAAPVASSSGPSRVVRFLASSPRLTIALLSRPRRRSTSTRHRVKQ